VIKQNKGLLEAINVRLEKNDGEGLKKTVDAAKAVLDSIGTSSATRSQ
jgi:hypothetical protein